MIDAVLKLKGTVPDAKEELMVLIMVVQRTGRHALTSAVAMGSRGQVEALDLVIGLARESTGAKEERQHWGRCGVDANKLALGCPMDIARTTQEWRRDLGVAERNILGAP